MDVFISYSRENQQQVVRLVEYLREQGLGVWMDETDIHGATMWTVEAIHKWFILAISRHSTGSKNVVKELALASEREKIILPILEQCDIPKNMEYQLAGIQNIALPHKAKAFDWLGVESTLATAPAWAMGTWHHPRPRAAPANGSALRLPWS